MLAVCFVIQVISSSYSFDTHIIINKKNILEVYRRIIGSRNVSTGRDKRRTEET